MIEMFGVKLRQMESGERKQYNTNCLRALCEMSTYHEGILLCLTFIDKEDKLPQRGYVMNNSYDADSVVKFNKDYVTELMALEGELLQHDCWIFIELRESMDDDVRKDNRTFYVYNGMLLKESMEG